MRYLFVFTLSTFLTLVAVAQMQLPTSIISACDYHIGSQGITPIQVGSRGVRYDIRYMLLDKMYQGSTVVDNSANALEKYQTHQISFYYHIAERFSASLFVPVVMRSESGLGNPVDLSSARGNSSQSTQHNINNSPYNESAYGLSDISLFGRYMFITNEESSLYLSMSVGVKLPTGATDALNPEGELLYPHMQPGSGSFDPIISIDAAYSGEEYVLSLNLLSAFPTEGAQSYEYGTMLSYGINAKYSLLDFNQTSKLVAAIGLSGEWHGMERHEGEMLVNTGGNTTYIYPGVQLLFGENMSFDLSYHYPIIHSLNGTQLGESYKLMGGVQYLF